MRAVSARTTLVIAGLGVVALGSLALTGWVHPAAPDGALVAFLPGITLPTLLIAAVVDGINPCAFTVLLLLVTAVVASLQAEGGAPDALRARILTRGGLFVAAIFLTYLALGVGIMGSLGLFTTRHWPARAAALLAVLMGLWMMKDYFLPGSRWQLKAPRGTAELARRVARRGSVPALLLGGVLIGLCTVPCSGAVYLAILSLISLQTSRAVGFGYLVLYNVVFVLPLVLILVAATTRPSLRVVTTWNRLHHRGVRLVLGVGVVLGGLAILATV